MPKHAYLVAVALCTVTLLRTSGVAQSPGNRQHDGPQSERLRELTGEIRSLVRNASFDNSIGVSVLDTATGQALFAHNSSKGFNPASNMKVLTAAAALVALGPEFRARTGLYGRVEGGQVQTLVLKGFGDPTLSTSALVELAQSAADRGVRAVEQVYVDGGYFDDQTLPPAFEQQPNEVAPFRSAVAAVSVDRSSYLLHVLPGAEAGHKAIVRLAAPGYFELDNQLNTATGAPKVIAIQRATPRGTMTLSLRGSVPPGSLAVSYRRRVEDPLAHAAHALTAALSRAGIRGPRRVVNPSAANHAVPNNLPLLASRRSPRLAQMLYELGKRSDNYYAEMTLKIMGAERKKPGSSRGGLETVRALLKTADASSNANAFVNGSGLFEGNRIAPATVTKLLRYMYRHSGYRAEFVSHLSVGGIDGTLKRRFKDLAPPRSVRAKTGTLNDVIALSGYALGRAPNDALAFSILINGAKGRHGPARALCDAIAAALVRHLHEPSRGRSQT